MTKKMEKDLISKLSKEGVKKPLSKPIVTILLSCGTMAIYLGALIAFFGLRSDFSKRILELEFQIEIFLLLLCALVSCSSISLLRIPDIGDKKAAKYLSILCFATFVILMIFKLASDNGSHPMLCGAENHECLLSIIILSIAPLLLLILILSKGIVTNFKFCTISIGISGGTISYLLLRMSHETENISHLVIWHLLPIILVIFLSSFLIKSFTKNL